jgi:hypothetical protein
MKTLTEAEKDCIFLVGQNFFFIRVKAYILFFNVWRKSVFDIYFTEFGTALTTILPIVFQYCYKDCYSNNKITELRAISQRESQNS